MSTDTTFHDRMPRRPTDEKHKPCQHGCISKSRRGATGGEVWLVGWKLWCSRWDLGCSLSRPHDGRESSRIITKRGKSNPLDNTKLPEAAPVCLQESPRTARICSRLRNPTDIQLHGSLTPMLFESLLGLISYYNPTSHDIQYPYYIAGDISSHSRSVAKPRT